MNRRLVLVLIPLLGLLALLLSMSGTTAQGPGSSPGKAPLAQTLVGTAFTYQGQLNDANGPVTGAVTLEFNLYDAPARGTLIASAGPINVNVVDGLFTQQVDFGIGAFDGTERYLEIVVDGVTLAPRQAVTPTPYALALPGLYTLPNATSPNLIGGYSGNSVGVGVVGATIGGGGASGSLPRIHRRTRMDGVRTAEGGG